jgi:ParB family transcriptional regulator, chromosome partitioning protein
LGNISSEINSFKLPNTPAPNEAIPQKNTVDKKPTLEVGSISLIAITDIQVNPKQPRRHFDEQALTELSESIKLHGIIQPITVIRNATGAKCPYQLISGERRWRASKLAGLTEVPAYLRTADNQEQIELALLENLQREDLNAIEIALSYRLLMEECNLNQEEVAERMKKERSTVTNYLRLLKLPPTIQQSVIQGKISMGHARSILSVEHIEQQLFMHNEVMTRELSVRQTEALAKELNKTQSQASTAKGTTTLAPIYKKIQDNISSTLSTKVQLTRKANGKGDITIEYYNDDDLTRILSAMGIVL